MVEYLVVIDRDLAAYKFSETHPLNPIRVLNTYDLAAPVLAAPNLEITKATAEVSPMLLQSVHTPEYIAAIKATANGNVPNGFGLGSADVPVFANMHEATVAVCSATLTATMAVASSDAIHAVNVAGGLHHAMPSRASGFCVYNDIAVSIQWLLENGYERIAYIDIDAHHGDGVQSVFYDDPRVLTFSIHESGKTLFPGTGAVAESGTGPAHGFSVNVPLPAHTTDADWLRAISSVLPEILAEFQPQLIFSQHGCDSHSADPLTNLEISLTGQKAAHALIHDFAHEYANGQWIAVGGGGYDIYEVVPKTWTNLLAIATHQPELAVYEDMPAVGIKTIHQGWDPNSEIDRIIMQVRREIYPAFGLLADPHAAF